MTHAAVTQPPPVREARIVGRPHADAPIFRVEGRASLFLRAGAAISVAGGPEHTSGQETEIDMLGGDLVPGADYFIRLDEGRPVAFRPISADTAGILGGFHFAPGGNATARAGGDDIPAINPASVWDAGFRPACPDPRGMTLVDLPGRAPIWVDIYLLGVEHVRDGTSRCGVRIAHGDSLPMHPREGGHVRRLDYETATAIYAGHGKQLLAYDEFRAAAFGVAERSAAARDPGTTGLDAARTSRFGLMQATGNLWVWGTDGDADEPAPSLFGGSWFSGSGAGSRYAPLGYWPGSSDEDLSARGRCGHLSPG